MRKILFLVSVSLFFKFPLYSSSLELEDFITSALENNFSLRRAEERVRAAAGARSEARGRFFPSFSASFQGRYTDTVPEMDFVMPVAVDPGTGQFIFKESTVEMGQEESYSARLQLRQPLLTFGRISGGSALAGFAHQIEELNYQGRKDKLKGEVKKNFYAFLLAREMAEIAQKQKSLMQENLKTTRALFKAGRVSNLDVNRVRSHLLIAEDGLEEALNGLRDARESLFNISVIEDRGREIRGELEYREFNISLEDIMEQALRERKEPEMAELNVRIARREQKMELARNLPRVYGFASYNFDRPDQALRDEWGRSWVVGGMIEIDIPLLSVPGQMKKVKARLNKAEAGKKDISRGVELQVSVSHRYVSRLEKRVSLMEENLQITSESLNTARRQYEGGRISNIELNQAILDYTSARREHASALHDFLAGLEDLKLAAGGRLP